MDNPIFPTLMLQLTTSGGIRQIRRARQGDIGRQQLLVITDAPYTAPESLGFRASCGGEFVDVREGFSRTTDGDLLFTIPTQTFSVAGQAVCYFYVFDGDKIMASTNEFIYDVQPQFARGIGGSSYSKTLDQLQADLESTLATLKDEVSKWINSVGVEGEVKRQLSSTLASIQSWETAQKATLDASTSALDKAQSQWIDEYNKLAAELTTLQTAQANAEKATSDATQAATTATTAATTATASAKAADTSKAAADKSAATATQAATDAGKATTDSKTATTDAKAATELAKQAADNANNVSATITDADLAAWVTQEAGE